MKEVGNLCILGVLLLICCALPLLGVPLFLVYLLTSKATK